MHWLIRLMNRIGNGSLRFGRRLGKRSLQMAQAHFEENQKLEFTGYIENQTVGAAARIQMGEACRLIHCLQKIGLLRRACLPGYNACGWVAVYNALLTLGEHVHPARIVRALELGRGLNFDGLFGTDPRTLAAVMEQFGCRARTIYQLTGADEALRSAGTGILCVVNPGGILHGAHNINVTWNTQTGSYFMHNAPGVCQSVEAYLTARGMQLLSLTLADAENPSQQEA